MFNFNIIYKSRTIVKLGVKKIVCSMQRAVELFLPSHGSNQDQQSKNSIVKLKSILNPTRHIYLSMTPLKRFLRISSLNCSIAL
jgi:hypothetical protein